MARPVSTPWKVELTGADQAALDILMAEYKEAKAEQRDRIRWRDSLVYAVLAVQALATSAVSSGRGSPALLLALPLVGFLLGQNYLANDGKIVEIRRDIRTRIAPALRSLLVESSLAESLFAWEDVLRRQRSLRKVTFQLLAHLVAFAVLPAGGVAWFAASHSPAGFPQVTLAIAGLALLVLLAVEFVRASGVRPARYS